MADDPWANYRQGDAAKLGAPAAAPVAAAPAPAPAAPAAAPAAAGGDPWANYRKGDAGAAAAAAAPAPQPISAAAPQPSSAAAPAGVDQTIGDMLLRVQGPWNAPANQPLSQTAFWNKPSDVSWGKYVGAHLQPLDDIVRSATNTFGLGDRFAAGMSDLTGIGGGDLAAQKAQTAAAEARMPTQNRLAANMIGYGPLAAQDIAGALGGGVLGSAAEGATAGGLAAAGQGGHMTDVALGMLGGGAGGAGVGALSKYLVDPVAGALSRTFSATKATPPEVGAPQSSTGPATGMYAQKVAAYAPLDSIAFDNHGQAINQAQASIRAVRDPNDVGVDLGIPKDVNDIVTNLTRNPVVSGRNLQQASSDLRASGDWTGHRFADAIDNHLDTAQPMSIGAQPTGQVGDAGAAKNAGDLWYQRIEDLERLAKESPSGAPGPTPSAVQQTKGFYQKQPDSPQYQALDALQQAMQPKFNFWTARHIAAPVLGGLIHGGMDYLNPAEGQNRYLSALEGAGTGMLEGAALYGGGHALARARPGAALNAARYAIGTGQPLPGGQDLGSALRYLLLGNLAPQLGPGASNQSPF